MLPARCVLVGWSLGGQLALELARRAPATGSRAGAGRQHAALHAGSRLAAGDGCAERCRRSPPCWRRTGARRCAISCSCRCAAAATQTHTQQQLEAALRSARPAARGGAACGARPADSTRPARSACAGTAADAGAVWPERSRHAAGGRTLDGGRVAQCAPLLRLRAPGTHHCCRMWMRWLRDWPVPAAAAGRAA